MARGLTPEELGEFKTALLSAFPTLSEFRQVVFFGLGENLEQIVGGQTSSEIIGNLVQWAESHNRTADLLKAAQDSNPGNSKLKAFAQSYWSNPPPLPSRNIPTDLRTRLVNALMRV